MSPEAAELLAGVAVNSFWQIAVLAAAAWIIHRQAKIVSVEFTHKLWVLTLALAALLPLVTLAVPFSAIGSLALASVMNEPASAGPPGLYAANIDPGVLLPAGAVTALAWVYLLTVLVSAIRLLRIVHATWLLVRCANHMEPGWQHETLWHRARGAFNVKQAVLAVTHLLPTPAAVSLPRPTVLIPARLLDGHTSQGEFLAALGHECAHLERQDFTRNLVYEVATLPIAFHPLTWFIKSRIAHTRELICDGRAAERLMDRRSYAESLLGLARRVAPAGPPVSPVIVQMFDANSLEDRVMTLTSRKPLKSTFTRIVYTAAATAMLCCCALLIGVTTPRVSAQSAGAGNQPGAKQTKNLTCTYYHSDNSTDPGTCGYGSGNKTAYRCYSDRDPSLSQEQVACREKLQKR